MTFQPRNSYDYDDLIACGHGKLFGPGTAQLPLPPMLMFDRITHVGADDGEHGRGSINAELDVHPGLWFFDCHFSGDPVMPGCLGLDALWQLGGFYLGWRGGPGRGRALGAGEVKFTGQITQQTRHVKYRLDLKRVIMRKLYMGIADGFVEADGTKIYTAKDLRVGLFSSADSF